MTRVAGSCCDGVYPGRSGHCADSNVEAIPGEACLAWQVHVPDTLPQSEEVSWPALAMEILVQGSHLGFQRSRAAGPCLHLLALSRSHPFPGRSYRLLSSLIWVAALLTFPEAGLPALGLPQPSRDPGASWNHVPAEAVEAAEAQLEKAAAGVIGCHCLAKGS